MWNLSQEDIIEPDVRMSTILRMSTEKIDLDMVEHSIRHPDCGLHPKTNLSDLPVTDAVTDWRGLTTTLTSQGNAIPFVENLATCGSEIGVGHAGVLINRLRLKTIFCVN